MKKLVFALGFISGVGFVLNEIRREQLVISYDLDGGYTWTYYNPFSRKSNYNDA